MSEETCGEVWEREQSDGVPVGMHLKRVWRDHKIIICGWVIVLGTIEFVAASWPLWMMNGFLLLFCIVSIARIVEVHNQRRHFNDLMGIVRSLPKESSK